MKQNWTGWVQVTGWSTALASIADAGAATSSQVDNSTQKSYAMDVGLTWDKDGAAGTGTIELWLLPEINDGAAQDSSAPPRGGSIVMVVSTAAETTTRYQYARFSGLPQKFKFYILNSSGSGLNTNADVYYNFVDFVDV